MICPINVAQKDNLQKAVKTGTILSAVVESAKKGIPVVPTL